MKLAAVSFAVCLAMAASARAELSPCAATRSPTVVLLRAPSADAWQQAVARQLAAGLAASGVQVCIGEASQSGIAQIEIAADSFRADAIHIRVNDAVTRKVLERTVELANLPQDTRSVAVALYVEELLQASWAELALRLRVYLKEHQVTAPPAVTRELSAVFPVLNATPSRTRVRVAVGVSATRFVRGITQLGPELSLGYRVLPWLEPALKVGYRLSPRVAAVHGRVEPQALLVGVLLEPRWQVNPLIVLGLPQGFDVLRLTFLALPDPLAGARSAVRNSLVVSHGLSVHLAISALLTLSSALRFCWALLPAQANDEGQRVVGTTRLGGEAALTLDANF